VPRSQKGLREYRRVPLKKRRRAEDIVAAEKHMNITRERAIDLEGILEIMNE
jgi:hypothetical protein